MDRASQRVPGIQTLPLRAFEVREEIGGDVALARLLGLEGSLQAPTLHLEPRTAARARSLPRAAAPYCDLLTLVPGREAPRLVVIQDSFGIELQPFLSETFARACFLGNMIDTLVPNWENKEN